MGVDYSFLRLKPTLSESLDIDKNRLLDFRYVDCIHLSPSETYLQITNFTDGVAFDGNYEVWIISTCGKELHNITERVAIEEFQDSNFVQQFSFELCNLGIDKGFTPIALKFVHTVSDVVLYSNHFILSASHLDQTTRFDYRGYGKFEGIDYERANKMQSIRLNCFYDVPTDETESKGYYQISTNNTVSSRPLIKRGAKYKCDRISTFAFPRYNLLLNHDVIYIEGIRATNKTILKPSERLGSTNVVNADFNVFVNENDTYTPILQIFQELAIISYYPNDTYTPQTPPVYNDVYNEVYN